MSTNSNQHASATRDKLVEDVKILTKDVQDLLKATASVVGEKAAEARVKVEDSLKAAQEKLAVVQENVKAKGKEARVLPVPDWLWNAILTMPKTVSEWVFPAEDGKPHRAQFCKKPLQRVCTKLGLGNVTHQRYRARCVNRLHRSLIS